MTPPAEDTLPRFRKVWAVIRPVSAGLLLIAALAMFFTDWPDSEWIHSLVLVVALTTAGVDFWLRKKAT